MVILYRQLFGGVTCAKNASAVEIIVNRTQDQGDRLEQDQAAQGLPELDQAAQGPPGLDRQQVGQPILDPLDQGRQQVGQPILGQPILGQLLISQHTPSLPDQNRQQVGQPILDPLEQNRQQVGQPTPSRRLASQIAGKDGRLHSASRANTTNQMVYGRLRIPKPNLRLQPNYCRNT